MRNAGLNEDWARSLLQRRRKDLEGIRESIEASTFRDSEKASIDELSMYDNHPADIGTETFEREKDLGLKRNAERQLAALDEAMERLEAGEYGVCEKCGATIPPERLEAVPETTLCVECSAGEDWHAIERQRRPAEEDVMYPPFGRSFTDDDQTQVGYDGEDVWQELERYGTATNDYDDEDERRGAVSLVEEIVDENGEPTVHLNDYLWLKYGRSQGGPHGR